MKVFKMSIGMNEDGSPNIYHFFLFAVLVLGSRQWDQTTLIKSYEVSTVCNFEVYDLGLCDLHLIM